MKSEKNAEKILLDEKLIVINVGIEIFSQSLEAQGVETIQVDWKPTPILSSEIIEILDQLL